MKKHADGGKRAYFQSTLRWISDKSRRSNSNKCQSCVKLQGFQKEKPKLLPSEAGF